MCGASSCCIVARGMVIGDSPLSLFTALLSLSASYWTWTSSSTVAQSVELLSDHTAHVAAHVLDQCPSPAPCPAPVCAACGRCEACTIVKAGWPDITGFYLGVIAGVLLNRLGALLLLAGVAQLLVGGVRLVLCLALLAGGVMALLLGPIATLGRVEQGIGRTKWIRGIYIPRLNNKT